MFRNPYDTTIGMLLGIGYEKLSTAIQLFAQTHGDQVMDAPSVEDEGVFWTVKNITPGLGVLPSFAHPVTIIDDNKSVKIYSDVRNFTRLSNTKELVVSSNTDYNFAVIRGKMQYIWVKDDTSYDDVLSLGPYPMAMFSRTLSALLVRRFGLSPDVQMTINIILSYYYLCMFKDIKDSDPVLLDEKEVLMLSRMITQGTYIQATDIIPVISVIPVMKNVKDLVAVLKQHAGTIRFDALNEAIIFELFATVWAGANYREIAQVALEHPPTWVAMLFIVLKNRGFANSYLSRTCKDFSKGGMDDVFIRNMVFLLRND